MKPTDVNPNVRNRVEQHIEDAVRKMALDQSAFGQTRVSNELRKEGLFISPAGVRCVWMHHDLESFKKRLKALEDKVAEEGILLTEAQLAALEKKKEDDIVNGEIETHHPGYIPPESAVSSKQSIPFQAVTTPSTFITGTIPLLQVTNL